VVCCARSRYAGTGIVYEPKSIKAYFEILEKPQSIINSFEIGKKLIEKQLLCFGYWFFFHSSYHMPVLDPNGRHDINVSNLDHHDFSIASNYKFRRTVEKILSYL